MSNLTKLIEQERYHFEGTNGVKNLCRIVRALGYKDPMYFGQFEGASYGDLINFLEDNSGAVDKIIEFIEEEINEEWEQNLESHLEESDDEDGE